MIVPNTRNKQVPVKCEICAKEWTVKPSRAAQNNAITCSRECLATLRSRNIIRYRGSAETRNATCESCGKEFVRKPSQLAKYGATYCGKECQNKAKLGVPNLKLQTRQMYHCEICGAEVWRTESTKEPHVYCSRACYGRDTPNKPKEKPNMQGEKHWRWKGGVSSLPYAPGWDKRLRASIRKRDDYTCQICKLVTEEPGALVVHHKDWGKTNHHPDNLITLCRSCHSRHHHGLLALPV